jgi:hypothetical protein
MTVRIGDDGFCLELDTDRLGERAGFFEQRLVEISRESVREIVPVRDISGKLAEDEDILSTLQGGWESDVASRTDDMRLVRSNIPIVAIYPLLESSDAYKPKIFDAPRLVR